MSEPAAETPWQRVHPASLAVNLLPQAWRTARNAWPIFLAILLGSGDLGLRAMDLSLLVLFLGLTLARTFVHFVTLRYRLHDGRLEVKSGLLDRQARSIDPRRIQNMELVQNIAHRVSGLVELRIETAGEASTEGLLSALDVAEAERLRDALRRLQRDDEIRQAARSGQAAPADETDLAEGETLVALGAVELLAYGLSRRTMGTVALLSAVGLQVLELAEPQQAEEVVERLGAGTFAAMVLLAFAASFVISAGQAILRHFRYRVYAIGQRLVTEEGLTTRRRVEIPLRKVQIVRTDEPWLRRAMGYGTLMIETAGLGISDGQVRQAEGVVPMVPREELGDLTRRAIPRLDVDPWQASLLPPHPRALYRGVVHRLAGALVLSALATALAFPWGALAVVLFLPGAVVAAWLDWRWQGWLVTDDAVISRRGYFTRRTWVVARDKIQSVHVGQTPFMRWNGLASVVVRAAGSDVDLPDIGRGEALQVMLALSPESRSAPTQQQAHRQHAADDPHEVGGQAGGDGMAEAADADTAEVDRQDVEGRLGRAVHRADQVADVAVGAVGLDQLGGDAEGAGARQGPQQGQGQRLGGQAQGAGEAADEAGDHVEPTALPQHAHAGQDGDQVRDDRDGQ